MQIDNNSQGLSQSALDILDRAIHNVPPADAKAGGTAPSANKTASLNQNEFLTLMLAQLKNQDPTKPLDSTAFLGQLAQISQVQGLAQLNDSFSTLSSSLTSNQALQASSLLGRNALVEGHAAQLGSSGAVTGAIDLPQASTQVMVTVTDAAGNIVQQASLGQHAAGLAQYSWNGTRLDGSRAAPGIYQVNAAYVGADGKPVAATTLINAAVQSVTMGAGQTGLTLSLAGVGDVAFSSVRQIS